MGIPHLHVFLHVISNCTREHKSICFVVGHYTQLGLSKLSSSHSRTSFEKLVRVEPLLELLALRHREADLLDLRVGFLKDPIGKVLADFKNVFGGLVHPSTPKPALEAHTGFDGA